MLDAKTVGRVVDLRAIEEQIAYLGHILGESEKSFGYFWKTAVFLYEKMQALQKQMKWLKKQEKEQRELRRKFEALSRRPTLPKEIIGMVFAHIPADNQLEQESTTRTQVYLDGLLQLVVARPCLVLRHFVEPLNTDWTLEKNAEKKVKKTVLEDASLTTRIKLRVRSCVEEITFLHSLTIFPHQWKSLIFFSGPSTFCEDNFMKFLKPCFSRLRIEDFEFFPWSVELHDIAATTIGPAFESTTCLKTVRLSLIKFQRVFKAGISNVNTITTFSLRGLSPEWFNNHGAFKSALYDLPYVLSQLPRLNRLHITGQLQNFSDDLEGLPSVRSASLRSIDINSPLRGPALSLFALFQECRIDCIALHGYFLREVEKFSWDIRRITIEVRS